ncbi:MAG: LysM peptidoglycan-binding domain-containing protein [Anaerolineae bacterium]|nr:LysM peptidoglycan-binding domain-containing protein [Anaerolineae bacterium]
MALIGLRPPGNGQFASLQNETATPIAYPTATPTPVAAQNTTATPVGLDPVRVTYVIQPGDTLLFIAGRFNISLEQLAEMNPELDFSSCNFAEPNGGANCSVTLNAGQEINIAATPFPGMNQTICEVFSLVPDGIEVYSQPELDALVVGHVPAGVPLAILDQANGPFSADSPDTIVWFYVSALVDRVPVQGWVSARYTSQLSTNCLLTVTVVPALPANVDPFMITATAIIAGATETAEAVTGVEMSGAAPTVVPPCTGIAPVAPGLVNCLNVSATPIPTPTSMFFASGGQGVMTSVQVGSIPPNTSVIITSGYFDGTGWVYSIQTTDAALFAEGVRDSQLAFLPGYTPPTLVPTLTATPTAMFMTTNPRSQVVQTVTQVGTIPANTLVLVGSAYYNGGEWIYSISEDGINYAEARESQLSFGAGDLIPTVVMPICFVSNAGQESLRVRTQPSTAEDSIAIGLLPPDSSAEVLRQGIGSDGQMWYFVRVAVGDSSLTGWIQVDSVLLEDGCVLPLTATPTPLQESTMTQTATPTPLK